MSTDPAVGAPLPSTAVQAVRTIAQARKETCSSGQKGDERSAVLKLFDACIGGQRVDRSRLNKCDIVEPKVILRVLERDAKRDDL